MADPEALKWDLAYNTFVGRLLTPSIRLEFCALKTAENGKFSEKYKHLEMVWVVGGGMTPPYEAISNRAIN